MEQKAFNFREIQAREERLAPGHRMCAGCGGTIAVRNVLKALHPGDKAVVPGRSSITERTLVLVLDLSCPSCQKALEKLSSDPEWAGTRHLAVCFGPETHPVHPDWEFLFDNNSAAIFDPQMTPIFFVVAADGSVEKGYTMAL